MANTISFGGYNIDQNWKIVPLQGARNLIVNPNDPNQRTVVSANSGSSISEFLTQGGRDASATMADFPTLFRRVDEVGSMEQLGYAGTPEFLQKYGVDPSTPDRFSAVGSDVFLHTFDQTQSPISGQQEKDIFAASGVLPQGRVSPNIPGSAGTPKTKMVNGVRIDLATGQPYATTSQGTSTQQTQTPQFTLTGGNLKQGVYNNENVRQLQGLLGITADGDFGPLTSAAVKKFQSENGLPPDGIVGPATTAMLNVKFGTGGSSNLTAPPTGSVGGGVPTGGNTGFTSNQDSSAVESYWTSMNNTIANLQQNADNDKQEQINKIQQDKQNAQEELNNARASENTLLADEMQMKLDAFDTNMARYDEAYKTKQGFITQLMTLTEQGNVLIAQQKGVSGLALIRNPRVAETIANLTAQAAVLQIGINASEFNMTSSNNIINTAMSAITSIYSNQLDYYSNISKLASDKVIKLEAEESDFMTAKIATIEAEIKRVQDNADKLQEMFTDPTKAVTFAKAGITLFTPQSQWGALLAKQADREEIKDTINEYVSDGYTPTAVPTANTITIQAGGQTLYFKKPPEKASGGGNDKPMSPNQIEDRKS